MPEGPRLRSRRNYVRVLVLVVGLALLAAPLWVPALHLDDPTVTYERAEVVTDDGEGIHFANESISGRARPISDEIACTDTWNEYRICAYERYLLGNVTIPSGWYTSSTDSPREYQQRRSEFVQLGGTTYRPSLVVNESVQNARGMYRIDLSLESVPLERALDEVARDPDTERPRIDPVVREAAKTGVATTHRDIEDLATVFEADDGSYYRVYRAGSTLPNGVLSLLEPLLVVILPGLGLGVLLGIGSDVRASPTEDGRERSER